MPVATALLPGFKIRLGSPNSGFFDPGVPVLGGDAVETLFASAQPAGHLRSVTLFRRDEWLVGIAVLPLIADLDEITREIYRTILEATNGRHLARIWNYVPAINEPGPTGLENYRAFCRGRSMAFEQHHGSGFKALLPAASAVGSKSATLTVLFAACSVPPRHVENPLQMSAYDYPDDYGPRAPSFARATVVPDVASSTVFISGTAAIRGHQTVAPRSLRQQLECTVENLREVSASCGLGPDLDLNGTASRHFKVYLRHATDLASVAALLEQDLLTKTDHVSYLQADVCRAELLVEIEASLVGVTAIRT